MEESPYVRYDSDNGYMSTWDVYYPISRQEAMQMIMRLKNVNGYVTITDNTKILCFDPFTYVGITSNDYKPGDRRNKMDAFMTYDPFKPENRLFWFERDGQCCHTFVRGGSLDFMDRFNALVEQSKQTGSRAKNQANVALWKALKGQ